jgi:hypothetical protein
MSTAIIHNTGTNYTLYYNIMYWFRTIMSNHPSIEVVTTGDWWDIGEREFPGYVLGNISILDVDFGTNVTNYTCTLTIADKVKNKNNESDPRDNKQIIPFYQTDDKIDVWANTLAILNDLSDYTQRSVTNFDINGDIVCTPFADRFDNGLAGWTAQFVVTTHNDKNRCLFNLSNPVYLGYRITNCDTLVNYNATFNLSTGHVIGSAFATLINDTLPADYGNLKCYSVGEGLEEANWDLKNVVIQNWPQSNLYTCDECKLWIAPKVWNTTPAKWSGLYGDFRTWITD